MPYLITYASGATQEVKNRPAAIPPGGSIRRITDAKAAKPAPAPVLTGQRQATTTDKE